MTVKQVLMAAMVVAAFRGAMAQAPMRYRVTVANKASVDMSQLAHGKDLPPQAPRTTKLTAFLSITERDSAGGRLMRLKVDSMVGDLDAITRRVSSTMPPELAGMAKSAIGEQITLLLVNGKRLYLGRSASMSVELGAITGALPLLLVGVPKGAVRGARWADTATTDTTVKVADFTMVQKNQMVTVWTMATADSLTGAIDSKGSQLIQRANKPGGTMTASTSGTAMVLLDGMGLTRRGTMGLRSTMKIQMPGPGDVATTSYQTITVERVQ